MKKLIIAASTLATLTMSATATAGNTIEFLGEITDSTCDVIVEGSNPSSANGVVTLPTLSKKLLDGDGKFAGRTSFALVASNCTLANGKTKVAAFFNGNNGADATAADQNNVDSVTGYLNNITTDANAATNVKLRLIDGTNGSYIKAGYTDQVTGAGFVTVSSGNARMPYAVEYIAVGGAATSGQVRGVVVYDLQYN